MPSARNARPRGDPRDRSLRSRFRAGEEWPISSLGVNGLPVMERSVLGIEWSDFINWGDRSSGHGQLCAHGECERRRDGSRRVGTRSRRLWPRLLALRSPRKRGRPHMGSGPLISHHGDSFRRSSQRRRDCVRRARLRPFRCIRLPCARPAVLRPDPSTCATPGATAARR